MYYCRETNTRTISFKDGQGVEHCLPVDKQIYDVFDEFELLDISALNKYDRYAEHSDLTEKSLNSRVMYPPIPLEEIVFKNIQRVQLHKAIETLPDIQKRRLHLCFFNHYTLKKIAQLDNCSPRAIKYSLDSAKNNLKKGF